MADASVATPPSLSASAKRLTLVATILGSSIAILDSSVVSVALPSIQRSLGGGLGLRWGYENLGDGRGCGAGGDARDSIDLWQAGGDFH